MIFPYGNGVQRAFVGWGSMANCRDLFQDNNFKLLLFAIILVTGTGLWLKYLTLWFSQPDALFYDFKIYYNGAEAFLHGKNMCLDTIYDYLPFPIVFFIGFALFSFPVACLLFSVFNLILLFLMVYFMERILLHYGIALNNPERIGIFLALIFFVPTAHNFVAGQINIFLALLITLTYYELFIKRNGTGAAWFLSLATILKIWPVILYFLNPLYSRIRGFFFKFCLFLGSILLFSIILFGFPLHADCIGRIEDYYVRWDIPDFDFFHPVLQRWPDNIVGIFIALRKILHVFNANDLYPLLSVIWTGLEVVAFFCVLLYLYIRRPDPRQPLSPSAEILGYSVLIGMFLVFFKMVEGYYAIMLFLPLLLIVYVLQTNVLEKVLLISSVFCFCIRPYVEFIGRIIGGPIQSMVYIVNPAMIGFCLFFILAIYMMERRPYSLSTETIA